MGMRLQSTGPTRRQEIDVSLFELTEAEQATQRLIREFATREIAPHSDEWDEAGALPLEVYRRLGELGVFGLAFPAELGGNDGGLVAYCLALEELGKVDASVCITVEAAVTLAGKPLHWFGTPRQQQDWLVPLAQGEAIGAFGLTEPRGGSDTAGLATRAVRDGDDWVINGGKCFITNSGTPISKFVIVAARTGEKDITNFIVPRDTPGLDLAPPYHKLGWRSSDTRELTFTDCRVPDDLRLGETGNGLRQFLTVLEEGRIAVAAMSVGQAQGSLDQAVAYAKDRVQFGRPIIEHQAVAFRLADLATEIEAARSLTYLTARKRQTGAAVKAEAAMAKLFASETAQKAAVIGVNIFGGYGFMAETPISRFYRDAPVLTIGEGTSDILKILISRSL